MSRDFDNWNNEPVHITPPDVERVLRADDLRRERRRHMLIIAAIMFGVAIALWAGLRFG